MTQSWQTNFMEYKKLHQLSTGQTQKIALIDSGVSSNDKTNFSSTLIGTKLEDENGHESMMYSLTKGIPDKLQGISPNASIISIKIMGADGAVPPQLIEKGIEEARHQSATIINLSIGSEKSDSKISDEINVCVQSGITVVASAEDYSSEQMMFPADLPIVISMSAIDRNAHVLSLTSGAANTIINAPGGNAMTQGLDDNIFQSSGTSQATALVSGYIALLRDIMQQQQKKITNNQIITILKTINSGQETYYSALKNLK